MDKKGLENLYQSHVLQNKPLPNGLMYIRSERKANAGPFEKGMSAIGNEASGIFVCHATAEVYLGHGWDGATITRKVCQEGPNGRVMLVEVEMNKASYCLFLNRFEMYAAVNGNYYAVTGDIHPKIFSAFPEIKALVALHAGQEGVDIYNFYAYHTMEILKGYMDGHPKQMAQLATDAITAPYGLINPAYSQLREAVQSFWQARVKAWKDEAKAAKS